MSQILWTKPKQYILLKGISSQ